MCSGVDSETRGRSVLIPQMESYQACFDVYQDAATIQFRDMGHESPGVKLSLN